MDMTDKPVPATVLAVGAHPDDIEFMMGGTLALLGRAGWKINCLTVGNGSCGTAAESPDSIIRKRREEAREACAVIGGHWHGGFSNDLEITYSPGLTSRILAIVREARPRIMLVPSPADYMEDHSITARLAVTAGFARGMLNFPSIPPLPPEDFPLTVYHALPYGLRGPLREVIHAGQYADITQVIETKTRMLACHRSQKEWLDKSQGLDSYLEEMRRQSIEAGRMSGKFGMAEGWRRHSHLGFTGGDTDPLGEALAEYNLADARYEKELDS